MRPLAVLIIAMSMLASPAMAVQPARNAAAEVAQVIEARYFDQTRARFIADRLRATASRGDLDRFTDPRELAAAMTRVLEPFDGHFRVSYAPEQPSVTAAARPPSPDDEQAVIDRRANYGFRRVEILPGNIGYLDMRYFADIVFTDDDDRARRAADSVLQTLAGADALIIDLRSNGGGSPAMVGYLASAFTSPEADIYNVFRSRDGTESERPGRPYPKPRLSTPLYVVISGRTASAAEALAYTLQAAKRATIVGEASAGGANPGGEVRTPGGWLVFVSMGSPTNPITKRNWEGTGVRPDVPIPAGAALAHANRLALERVIAAGQSGIAALDTRWALESLTAPVRRIDARAYVGSFSGATVTMATDGTLEWRRGRRPALALQPLGTDIFAMRDDPAMRISFKRDNQERIAAAELTTSDGRVSAWRKE